MRFFLNESKQRNPVAPCSPRHAAEPPRRRAQSCRGAAPASQAEGPRRRGRRAVQCRKRLRGSSVNQTPPPPLVHERRPRGSRRCTELELSVVVVHESSRNSITERSVVHETRPLRGFANRTVGRALRRADDIALLHWQHFFRALKAISRLRFPIFDPAAWSPKPA